MVRAHHYGPTFPPRTLVLFIWFSCVFSGISSGSVVAFSRVGGGVHQSPVDREPVGANLELGELEQLTITNDNESSSYDVS